MSHRVMLLFLANGLFVAMWNSDRHAAPRQLTRLTVDIHAGKDPSPPQMTPGRFRVVDNLGHVRDLQVTAQALADFGIEPDPNARDLYIRSDGTRRWYFIRIDPENHALLGARSKSEGI